MLTLNKVDGTLIVIHLTIASDVDSVSGVRRLEKV